MALMRIHGQHLVVVLRACCAWRRVFVRFGYVGGVNGLLLPSPPGL